MGIKPGIILFFLSFSIFAQNQSVRPIFPPVPADSPHFSDTGDAAVARRYLEWAERAAGAGNIADAFAVLERGADFSNASSDISYFWAVLCQREKHSRVLVLEKCRLALATNRWEKYSALDARLLEAKMLTEMLQFEEALRALLRCDPEKYETQYQKLLALRGIAQTYGEDGEFLKTLSYIIDRFPRETNPLRVLFDYASQIEPNDRIHPLIDLALKRLEVLVAADPELAYMAAPFIWNRETARIYVAAYRASGSPNPASIPMALNLGLINGRQAADELFAKNSILDRDLITAVNRLLGTEEDRSVLRRNLLRFSGVITEDRDHDGIAETWTTFQNGLIREYCYDRNQKGVPDLIITFAQGIPSYASINTAGAAFSMVTAKQALLRWERYPAVLNAELDGKRYYFRPLEYNYAPLRFITLVLGGPDYPDREEKWPQIIERSLLSFANVLLQPSADFPGGTERFELLNGIPVKSTVELNGRKVSETDFLNGKPIIQYMDLDLDGRMETIRRFDPNDAYKVLSTVRDLTGDGIYE